MRDAEQLLARGGLYKEIHDLQLVDHARFAEQLEEIEEEGITPLKRHDEMWLRFVYTVVVWKLGTQETLALSGA